MFAALVLAAGVGVDADGLMSQVIARARETAKLRHERGLTGTKKEEKHDIARTPEKLIGTKAWLLEMAPDGFLQRPIQADGSASASRERPKLDIDEFIFTMHHRYRFHQASPEPVDGYYSVAFEPRNPPAPADDDEETVINHLSGVVYIDEQRSVRRIQGWLARPFSIKAIGRVQEATVLLDLDLLDGISVPRRSVCTVRYSKGLGLFLNTATRTIITYEYDPLPVPLTSHP